MKSARILIVALFVIGVFGTLVTEATIYARLFYLSTLLVGLGWFWARLSISGIEVVRRSRSLRANVGDIFEEHYDILNQNRWPSPWMEIINETAMPYAAGSRVIAGLGGKHKRTYIGRTWLTQRGSFLLGPTTLKAGDPFGLFQFTKKFVSREKLIVLPMLVEVASFPSPPGLLPGGKVVRQKALGVTPHAAGIREYASGDALRRIHWPTTARRGKLMVKEFDQDPQAETWIFLDAERAIQASRKRNSIADWDGWMLGSRPDFSLPPSTIEYAVTIAASLAHYFNTQRRAVGLVADAQTNIVIPADRSLRQEEKILETLAFIQGEGHLSMAGLVAAQAGQLLQGSSVVLITSSVRSEITYAVDDLLRRNLHPVVVLLDAASFGGPQGSEALVVSLEKANVPLCYIRCGADLGTSLSNFTADHSYQEVIQWFEQSTP
ncbi:MAG: DUF58 domain-containing protein [Anaerolineales bacterium]|nr:DUF58 domain-containing protein [Anaerolineales bacterium]